MAHGQWTEVEARGVIEAWRRSGIAITDFARERGIVPQRIYWWRKRLEEQDSQSTEELKLLPMRVVESREAKCGEPVTVLLRTGHMLKVGRGFDEEAFARVVDLLGSG